MNEDYQKEVARKIAERRAEPKRQELPEHVANLLRIVNNPANDGEMRRRAEKELEKYKSPEGFMWWENV